MLLTNPRQIGEILRARRKSKRISQAELAAKLGIGQSRLSTLERDAAGLTLDRLLAAAKLLGFEIEIRDTEPETKNTKKKSEW